MATFFKFEEFVRDAANKVHNLGSDTLKFYLTNNAPSASADKVKADLTGITEQNGYAEITATVTGSTQAAGVYSLVASDPSVLTGTGAGFGPFRYVVLYNDTPTSPADPLIGAWDYGSAITVLAGETFTIDLGSSILTLT